MEAEAMTRAERIAWQAHNRAVLRKLDRIIASLTLPAERPCTAELAQKHNDGVMKNVHAMAEALDDLTGTITALDIKLSKMASPSPQTAFVIGPTLTPADPGDSSPHPLPSSRVKS